MRAIVIIHNNSTDLSSKQKIKIGRCLHELGYDVTKLALHELNEEEVAAALVAKTGHLNATEASIAEGPVDAVRHAITYLSNKFLNESCNGRIAIAKIIQELNGDADAVVKSSIRNAVNILHDADQQTRDLFYKEYAAVSPTLFDISDLLVTHNLV